MCIGNHMFSSALWNKWAQVTFLKAKKIEWALAFINLWVNNIHAKISVIVLFSTLFSYKISIGNSENVTYINSVKAAVVPFLWALTF